MAGSQTKADGAYSWLYRQDSSRQVIVRADRGVQSTVPFRPGQQQGIAVQVYNPSSQTQTVLGPTSDISPACSTWHVSVSAENPEQIGFLPTPPAHYSRHGFIPPHQSRILRVLWASARHCPFYGTSGFDQLTLKVRVGLLTRTEVVALPQDWELASKPK